MRRRQRACDSPRRPYRPYRLADSLAASSSATNARSSRVSSSSWPPLPSSAPSPPQPPQVSSRAPRRPTRASRRRRPSTRPPLGVASLRPKPAPTPETKAKPTLTPESTRDPIPTPTRLRHSRRRRRGGRWARPPTARGVSRPYSRLSRRRRPRSAERREGRQSSTLPPRRRASRARARAVARDPPLRRGDDSGERCRFRMAQHVRSLPRRGVEDATRPVFGRGDDTFAVRGARDGRDGAGVSLENSGGGAVHRRRRRRVERHLEHASIRRAGVQRRFARVQRDGTQRGG